LLDLCAFDAIPSSFWRSLGLRLLCVSSGDVHRLWILCSSAIGEVTVLISHVKHVTVVTSWSEVVHQIFFIYGSVSYTFCRPLWSSLMNFSGSENSWLLVEDFNSVLGTHEPLVISLLFFVLSFRL